ncbi:protein O-linked-mannose beta-1,2-N-acetylglucosaminyltransferase 1-like [Eriocheir sinensis]|uniref:protein O-linked-mannose beta-1,2-N-acetylglucosaminyltransferase 1-like n=1 Tax=Eriocheir sinensis TaxID=95602 RepID=UPI0021C5FF29|nr:protein O-linked-mannose beta-1,2-N-acetylglucosaminyltransferase 1-like [Eriocheir sinensis]
MSLVSYLRRRVFGKSAFLIKRILLPAAVVFLLMQVLLSGGPQQRQQDPDPDLSNLIIPGEALDPALERKVGRGPTTHHNALHTTSTSTTTPPVPSPSRVKKKKEEEEEVEKKKVERQKKHGKDDDSDRQGQQQQQQQQQQEEPSPWSMATANITDSHKVKYKGHAITEKTVTLTLMSSQDKVFMSLNKREIYRNLGDRGIHLVVLNQYTGQVMARQVFDTFAVGLEEEMVEFIEDLSDGRILVFAVLDEASSNLSWRGRNRLKELGSRWADKLAYRDMWALVTRKGGLKMAETFSNVATADTGYEWGGPVFLRTDFDLLEGKGECDWPVNERNEARRVFCQRFEGYGALCDCGVSSWHDLFFHAGDEVHKELSRTPLYKDLGVVILATDRPHYLYRTLKSLWEAPGLNREKVAVYGDGRQREVLAVARLFGVYLVEAPPLGNTTKEHIRHKVQRVFRDVAGVKFPPESVPAGNLPEDTLPPFSCSHLLLLEDDLQVAVDIFKYIYSVAPVLERDPSIFAVSSFNYYGHADVANSHTTVYRTAELNPLALLFPVRALHQLASNWPTSDDTSEWYRSLRVAMRGVEGGALLYPEVPRARHLGYRGSLIRGSVQHNYFRDHILSLTTDYHLAESEVLMLAAEPYEARLEKTLKEADTINFDFCKHDLLYGKNPLKIFVSYNGSRSDETNMNYVMNCLRTFDVYPEAGWHGVWQFHYHGHWLSIVGTPTSKYSYLIPADHAPVTAPPTTTTTTTDSSSSSSSSSSSAQPSS